MFRRTMLLWVVCWAGCAPPPTVEGGEVAEGEPCETSSDCEAGLECARESSESSYVRCLRPDDGVCDWRLVGDERFCRPPNLVATGEPCESWLECDEGVCQSGRCVDLCVDGRCPDGVTCSFRWYCALRCDEVGGPECVADTYCLFGACRAASAFDDDSAECAWVGGVPPCDLTHVCRAGECVPLDRFVAEGTDCDGDGRLDCQPGATCGDWSCEPG